MNKLGHMRALALLATLGVTGCSRDCASRSATAEVGKGTPALETRSDPPRPVTGDDVVVVVSTEFGLFANGSHETDHGSGYCALVLGGKVRGGWILGRWPGLAKDQLFEGRDLAYTGHEGDGKVFGGQISMACRIRTGELGAAALLPTQAEAPDA